MYSYRVAWIFREYSCLKKVGRSPLRILGQKCFERMMYYRVFSHDVTATILVSRNNETAAMLVSQTNSVGVDFVSYANAFFCSNNFA